MKHKGPSQEDQALWHSVMQDIERCPSFSDRVHPHVPLRLNSKVIQDRRRQEFLKSHVVIPASPAGLSVGTKQLQIRKVMVESRLDLHGYTQSQALSAIQGFLHKAQINGWVWVLIITGKGQPDQENTLRQQVPKWLDSHSQVSGYAAAKPHDGGHGALYVRVKKPR